MDELRGILARMDVPASRRDGSQASLGWLVRNLHVRNSEHPEYERAVQLAWKAYRRSLARHGKVT